MEKFVDLRTFKPEHSFRITHHPEGYIGEELEGIAGLSGT